MGAAKHLQRHRINSRSNYLLFQVERELADHLDQRLSSNEVGVGIGQHSGVDMREGRASLWYSVTYPNTEEGSLCSTIRVEQGRRTFNAKPVPATHREGFSHPFSSS